MPTPRTAKSQRYAAIALAGLLIAAVHVAAHADRITVDGETWNDVLIYKSSTMYYVKVPEEGTIFNVPRDAVQPGSVEIVVDPYYRDELKARFDENEKSSHRRSAYNVTDIGAAPSGGGAAPATAGAGGANQVQAITQVLSSMGFTVGKEGNDIVATAPGGTSKLVIKGGTLLGGIDFTSTVPEAQVQMLSASLDMFGTMGGQAPPWVKPFIDAEVKPLLKTGGNAEKTEGPMSVAADVTKGNGTVTLHLTAGPAQAG